jgi:hypothetical protein
MKRAIKKSRWIAAVAAVAAAALLLCACTGPTIVDSSTGCVDEQSGITYDHASTCYQPVKLGKQHGTLKVGDKISYALHEIVGMNPAEWLATEAGDVLYAKGVTLPTLTEMTPVSLRVCMEAGTIVEVSRLDDAAVVQSVAAQYETGVSVTRPMETAPVRYTVRFCSETYAGLYYTLTYLEYVSAVEENGVSYGHYFLYDRMQGRFVAVDDTIHQLINGEWGSETDSTATDTTADTVAETDTAAS